MTFKAGEYVAVYIRAAQAIYYGKIDLVGEKDGELYVAVAKGVFYRVEPLLAVALPMRLVGYARAVLEGGACSSSAPWRWRRPHPSSSLPPLHRAWRADRLP